METSKLVMTGSDPGFGVSQDSTTGRKSFRSRKLKLVG